MERKEENNMFKYATKELSQDAFICWCINWINYDKNKNLGKQILKLIIGNKIKELNYDDIEVQIRRQYYNIDILLVINRKFFIIIEDKIDSSEHNQLDNYKKKLINLLDEDNCKKSEIENIRKRKSKLNIVNFNKNNIFTVYLKTGNFNEKDLKVVADNKVGGKELLETLEQYMNNNKKTDISYIVNDFIKALREKIELADENRPDKFIGKKLEVGTKFRKKVSLFKLFCRPIDI